MSKALMERVYKELNFEAYQWARHCVNYSDDIAADILQTVYLKILKGKAKYDNKSSLKTWLFSVIKFTVIDHHRATKTNESLDLVSGYSVNQDFSSLDEDFYINTLKRLSPNQAQVLLLVFYHDHTLEAVAEIMGLSIGSVRTHYDRGKKKLKKLLEKENLKEL